MLKRVRELLQLRWVQWCAVIILIVIMILLAGLLEYHFWPWLKIAN